MTARAPRPRGPAPTPADSPAATIASEVAVALAALRRASAAGKGVSGDTSLEILLDDLNVITGYLQLVDRDLLEMVR
jgi:hypothetical protein